MTSTSWASRRLPDVCTRKSHACVRKELTDIRMAIFFTRVHATTRPAALTTLACACLPSWHRTNRGYLGLQASRIGHMLWKENRKALALAIQSRVSEVFGMDIHPGCRVGKGVMIDHATGVVFGETAVVGNDCTFLHGVTLGGTGKSRGDRHPKLGCGILVGAGSMILGNIKIGDGCKVSTRFSSLLQCSSSFGGGLFLGSSLQVGRLLDCCSGVFFLVTTGK